MSSWSGLAVEEDGVKEAIRNLYPDLDAITNYVYVRCSAYVGPNHEIAAQALFKKALTTYAVCYLGDRSLRIDKNVVRSVLAKALKDLDENDSDAVFP
jgi:hypothetical protein